MNNNGGVEHKSKTEKCEKKTIFQFIKNIKMQTYKNMHKNWQSNNILTVQLATN